MDYELFNAMPAVMQDLDQSMMVQNVTDTVSVIHDLNPFSLYSYICGILMIIIACIGSMVNSITAYVFSRPTMSSSISILLAGLAIVDACLLTTASPIFAANALFTYSEQFQSLTFVSYATVYLYPLASIFQTASVWILTLITLERFVAVCSPFKARTRCTRRRARMALASVLGSSIAYNLVRFWDYKVLWSDYYAIDANGNIINYTLATSEARLRTNQDYVRIYVHWMYFAFLFALPFSALLILNALVGWAIRKARRERLLLSRRQSKEHATAAMMTIVVLVFLLCNCLAFVLNAMEVFGHSGNDSEEMAIQDGSKRHSQLFYFLIDANNLLIMMHCSFNFFIYYHFNQRFRLYVTLRVRYMGRYLYSKLRQCYCIRMIRSYESRMETDDLNVANALDEIGLELLRLHRDGSSRTMVSYLRRVSTRDLNSEMVQCSDVQRMPSFAAHHRNSASRSNALGQGDSDGIVKSEPTVKVHKMSIRKKAGQNNRDQTL